MDKSTPPWYDVNEIIDKKKQWGKKNRTLLIGVAYIASLDP